MGNIISLAENLRGQNLSPVQRQVLVLLKAVKKAFLSDHDAISTYYLKNILFWECDEKEVDFWMEYNSTVCVLTLMDRAEECLRKRHFPHYVMLISYSGQTWEGSWSCSWGEEKNRADYESF